MHIRGDRDNATELKDTQIQTGYTPGVYAYRQRPRSRGRAAARRDMPHVLLLAYVALVPILIIPVGGGAPLGAVDVLFPFALIVLLAQFSSRLSATSVFATLFLLSSAVSTALVLIGVVPVPASTSPTEAVLLLRVLEIYTPFFVVAGWKGWTSARARTIVKVAMTSSLVVCLIGIALHHAGVQVRETQQVNWYGEGLGSTLRAGGLLGNSGDFGHIASILGACALTLGVYYRLKPTFVLMAVAVSAYATLLSSSRAAILHLAIALFCMIPTLLRGKRALAIVGMTLTGVATLAFYISAGGVDPRLGVTLRRLDIFNISGESAFYSSSGRVSTWDQLMELIAQNPLTGIGYGMTVPRVGSAGDNSFLSITVELGLIAGISYIAFWATALLISVRSKSRSARAAAIALIVSEVAHMLTVDTHSMWATTPVALILIALALRECTMTSSISTANGFTRSRSPRKARLETLVADKRSF